MGRHGPLQKDRVPTYTVEERRAMHLARIRKNRTRSTRLEGPGERLGRGRILWRSGGEMDLFDFGFCVTMFGLFITMAGLIIVMVS
jgi:hypothetical protein